MQKKAFRDDHGQAAVEAIFSVLIILMLILASGQVLYTSMISAEAVKRVHKNAIDLFREVNRDKGNEVYTIVKKVEGEVEVSADTKYAQIINGWTLFHKDFQPAEKPKTKFGSGKTYRSVRGLMVAAGPLKGPGGAITAQPDGRSAFGVPDGAGTRTPKSDGDGYNNSGEAIRKDELDILCRDLGIEDDCNYFEDYNL